MSESFFNSLQEALDREPEDAPLPEPEFCTELTFWGNLEQPPEFCEEYAVDGEEQCPRHLAQDEGF